MSRIHEALKKAEEERAAVQTDRKQEQTVQHPAEQPVTPVAVKSVAEPAAVASVAPPDSKAAAASALLRFDELRAQCVKTVWKPDPKIQLFGNANPFAPGAEQFRTLRSRLYRIRESQPLHTLLLTSAMASEGKTLVSANLAQALVRRNAAAKFC